LPFRPFRVLLSDRFLTAIFPVFFQVGNQLFFFVSLGGVSLVPFDLSPFFRSYPNDLRSFLRFAFSPGNWFLTPSCHIVENFYFTSSSVFTFLFRFESGHLLSLLFRTDFCLFCAGSASMIRVFSDSPNSSYLFCCVSFLCGPDVFFSLPFSFGCGGPPPSFHRVFFSKLIFGTHHIPNVFSKRPEPSF